MLAIEPVSVEESCLSTWRYHIKTGTFSHPCEAGRWWQVLMEHVVFVHHVTNSRSTLIRARSWSYISPITVPVEVLLWVGLFYQPHCHCFLNTGSLGHSEQMELLLLYTCSEIMEALKAKWIHVTIQFASACLNCWEVNYRGASGTAVGILKFGVAWRPMSVLLECLWCNSHYLARILFQILEAAGARAEISWILFCCSGESFASSLLLYHR